jgi:hypothetical protein
MHARVRAKVVRPAMVQLSGQERTGTAEDTGTRGEAEVGGDQLPSWRETRAKRSTVEFVAAVTDPGSPDFIAEPDRIAVFDNDGTLWTERPVYAQLASRWTGRPSWAIPPARRSCTRAGWLR